MSAEQGYASIDDLFGGTRAAAETADVELPGGLVVTVRGLTRMELLLNAKGVQVSEGYLVEARNLACCMLRPRLTIEQAEEWQRVAPAGELADVVGAIRRLSGLADGAAKSGVPGDGSQPGT